MVILQENLDFIQSGMEFQLMFKANYTVMVLISAFQLFQHVNLINIRRD